VAPSLGQTPTKSPPAQENPAAVNWFRKAWMRPPPSSLRPTLPPLRGPGHVEKNVGFIQHPSS
jgi:hypothetical protein